MVSRNEVTFEPGLPVTRPECTVFDLVVDDEDLSLVSGVLGDSRYLGFDYWKLQGLLEDHYGKERGRAIYHGLMENSGLLGNLAPVLSPCNQCIPCSKQMRHRPSLALNTHKVRRVMAPSSVNGYNYGHNNSKLRGATMVAVTVGLAEAKNNFSKVTAEVNRTGRPVTVLKNNKPWVVIQPASLVVKDDAVDVAVDFMDEYADVFSELAK